MALYAADGSLRVTEVSGLAITGLYAADGSWNVVESLGTIPVGVYHPCGALWVTVVTSSNQRGVYAPDGSLYIQLTPFSYGNAGIRATDVSGTLSFSLAAPVLAWTTDGTDNTPAFTADIDPSALSTDYFHTQVSSSPDFSSISQEVTVAVADIESSLGLASLADETWYVRSRLERPSGTAASNWSNTVSQTIATTSLGSPMGLLLLLTKAA